MHGLPYAILRIASQNLLAHGVRLQPRRVLRDGYELVAPSTVGLPVITGLIWLGVLHLVPDRRAKLSLASRPLV